MRSKISVVSMLLVLWGSAPVTAQTYDQLSKWCYGDATDDQTIQGCDAVIKSGRETPQDQASAFNNRGFAYLNKGQYDRAIQDLDQAIKLNPRDANAFNNRGRAYNSKGQHDRAIPDLDQAIKLNPSDAKVFNNRGLSYSGKGQYDRAIQD